MLVGGCATTPTKPVKELTPEEQKFVGTYRREGFQLFSPHELVLQKNGRVIGYTDLFGWRIKVKWKKVDGKIQTISKGGHKRVFHINPDGTLRATNFLKYRKIK